MLCLCLVMAAAGGLTAFILNWRFLIVVCMVLLVGQGVYAIVHADLWNFVRTTVALATFQLGFLLSGLALETRRAWLVDRLHTDAGRSAANPLTNSVMSEKRPYPERDSRFP